ncbi:MAG: hypothetical protein IPM29_09320 [Planctomycetes bacterium]|nr:hypothetical protein [Planctomycetota bacterium]
MTPMKLSTLLTLGAAIAAPLAAQTTEVAVPRLAASFEGNDIAQYPFGRTGFRTQLLVTSSALAQANVFISAIEFRADTSNSIGSPAVTIPNVSIDMSVTSVTTSTMATDFATNITGPVFPAYQGAVTLPAHTSAPPQAAPWFRIQLTNPFSFGVSQGDLLIDISAANAGSTSTGYVLDSWLPGGTVLGYGNAGALSQPDSVRLTIAGNGTQGRFSGIVPTGQISILAQSQFYPWSGLLLLGFQPYAQPIDLGIVGAPGNSLYVDSVAQYPFTLTPPVIGFGYRYTWTLNIPAVPALSGQSLHMQPAVDDLPANNLGIVTGSAVQLVIGDPLPHPMRQVNANDYTATRGNYQYVSGIFGGAVFRLIGGFQ